MEQLSKLKFTKLDINQERSLADAEIESLVSKVGNYFLEYAVEGDSKNYANLDQLKGNFQDFSRFQNLHQTPATKDSGPKFEANSSNQKFSAPTLCMSVNMTKDGHKDIYIDLRNIGISVISPIFFALKTFTGTTFEMAMNSLIRPSLKQWFGNMRTFITVDNVFLFLLPPITME